MSDDIKPPSKSQLRLLDTAQLLRERPDTEFAERAYQARELVQATLPHKDPGALPIWSRSNPFFTLSIRPGFRTNPRTRQPECVGYPYGSIPRLLLYWITTEAVKRQNRKLELGASLNEFLRELGLNPATGGGKRGDAKRVQEQIRRLFAASISFEHATEQRSRFLDMPIVSEEDLFWSPKDPNQAALWGSWIILGESFFEAITAHPVPVDLRVLRALKQSPLALDLYGLIVYRGFVVAKKGQKTFIPWRGLHDQLGTGYSDLDNFKKKCKAALRKIAALHPAAPFGAMAGGVEIRPGRALVTSRLAE
jgi:Plasmid encoded RepA protein